MNYALNLKQANSYVSLISVNGADSKALERQVQAYQRQRRRKSENNCSDSQSEQ